MVCYSLNNKDLEESAEIGTLSDHAPVGTSPKAYGKTLIRHFRTNFPPS